MGLPVPPYYNPVRTVSIRGNIPSCGAYVLRWSRARVQGGFVSFGFKVVLEDEPQERVNPTALHV